MTRVRALAGGLFAASLGLTVGALWFVVAAPQAGIPAGLEPAPPLQVVMPLYVVALAAIGATCAIRRPDNNVGWLLLASAVLGSLVGFDNYASAYWAFAPGGATTAARWLAWLNSWLFIPWLAAQVFWLPLIFPSGKLPGLPWSIAAWVGAAAAVLSIVGAAADPASLAPLHLSNPTAMAFPRPLFGAAFTLLCGCALVAVLSVFVRLRSANAEAQQQMKCLGLGIAVLLSALLVGVALHPLLGDSPWIGGALLGLGYLALPVAIGVAILRFRLYDIDVVINRALVFAMLAVFIGAVYVLVVFGVGRLISAVGSPWLALAATALAALAFQPIRERAQRLANRLAYGRRSAPYEVLADLARRAALRGVDDELLTGMARAAADGTGAEGVEVWLQMGSQLRLAAAWPRSPELAPRTPDAGSGDRLLAVEHKGEHLGAIKISMPPGIELRPLEDRLLLDLAAHAGLVLHDRRLTVELIERVAELRDSRRRLVNVQDAERRRVERDLHDGAQQHLYALKLGLRQAQLGSENGLREPLAALEAEADQALQAVKELARGIFPPLLTAQGVPAALAARARMSAVDTTVTAEGVGRYPPDVEGAVYFCCLEAMQNALTHAQPTQIRINLEQNGGELVFTVADDGRGFQEESIREGTGLQNMRDRLDVLGGRLGIDSRPGEGTAVLGRIPAAPIGALGEPLQRNA